MPQIIVFQADETCHLSGIFSLPRLLLQMSCGCSIKVTQSTTLALSRATWSTWDWSLLVHYKILFYEIIRGFAISQQNIFVLFFKYFFNWQNLKKIYICLLFQTINIICMYFNVFSYKLINWKLSIWLKCISFLIKNKTK